MAGAWHTSCHPISKMHIAGEGPGETPSALRCLSYLINNFLTDIKHLAKTEQGHSPSLFWCLSQKFSLPFFTLIKLCYTKALEWSSLVPGPEAISSSSEITNPTPFTGSYHSDLLTKTCASVAACACCHQYCLLPKEGVNASQSASIPHHTFVLPSKGTSL